MTTMAQLLAEVYRLRLMRGLEELLHALIDQRKVPQVGKVDRHLHHVRELAVRDAFQFGEMGSVRPERHGVPDSKPFPAELQAAC